MILKPPNLFRMSAGTGTRGYVYASGYTIMTDRKTFIPECQQRMNEEFTRINGFKPGIRISDSGIKWPDFLMNGGGYIDFFVSERVIEDLKNEDVEILDATEFPIAHIEDRCRAELSEAPRYFVLEAIPEIIPDSEPNKFRKDTWTGRDLVSVYSRSMTPITTKLIVTKRIRELSERQRWTGVYFEGFGHYDDPRIQTEQAAPRNR